MTARHPRAGSDISLGDWSRLVMHDPAIWIVAVRLQVVLFRHLKEVTWAGPIDRTAMDIWSKALGRAVVIFRILWIERVHERLKALPYPLRMGGAIVLCQLHRDGIKHVVP